jgi:hypothetical protein
MTALNEAAFIGHSEILKLLLLHGADPAIPDDVGTLPLWFAVAGQGLDCVKLLLAARSPLLPQTTLNPALGKCNAVEYAARKQREVVIDWLMAVGGEATATCLRNYFPCLKVMSGVKPAFVEHLRSLTAEPQSLLRQCRCAVRQSMRLKGPSVMLTQNDYNALSLPHMLKVYLALGDLINTETSVS